MIGLVYHLELEIRTCCALLLETSLSLKFTDFRNPYMICRLKICKGLSLPRRKTRVFN